jgi:ABC-type ATPase involved in cell division
MVELRQVSKTYTRAVGGRVEALADLDLALKAGELAVVAGPPGSGKSTLLRLVAGEERPTRGAILVDGADLARLSGRRLRALRRGLSVVGDPRRLLPDRTALGNLTLVLRALGMPGAAARERALAALGEAGLAALRNALPGELAAGERERLALARALATEPRLLLVDEPAALLDDPDAPALLALLRGARAGGVTIVVATRAAGLAAQLDGRLLRLEAGRLHPEGPAG